VLALVITIPKVEAEKFSLVRKLIPESCSKWADDSINIYVCVFSDSPKSIDMIVDRVKEHIIKLGLHMCVVPCDNINFK
jgi:hypothetical protein